MDAAPGASTLAATVLRIACTPAERQYQAMPTQTTEAMNRAEDIEEAPANLAPAAARAYVEARVQGLCHEGALEVALGVEPPLPAGPARLEAVEFKIAHLERAVQELSDVLYRQQRELDAALAMNQRLRQQLEELESRAGEATPTEIPPHY